VKRFWLLLLSVSPLWERILQSAEDPELLVWEGYADPSFVKGFEEQWQVQSPGFVHGLERRAGGEAAWWKRTTTT